MAIFAGESPLMLSGDAKKDLELIRNYIYERDMELRHILSHLDESNFVEGFADRLATVNNITNEYNEVTDGGTDEPSGSVDLANATGILPVANGGTGRETLTVGAFLRGNGDSIALATPETALSAMNGQKAMSFATAMSTVSGVVGGKDISLATFAESDPNSVFSNSRYSASYGYGIKCAKAGKYLVGATLNLRNDSATASTTTAAIRKVVGGTSTYIAKVNHTFADDTSGFSIAMTITPQVFTFEANTYLSLYNALSTTSSKAEGCWLTAVYLGE